MINCFLEWAFKLLLSKKGRGEKWKMWKIENDLLVNKYTGYPFHDTWANRFGNAADPEDVPISWTFDYNSRNILKSS